MNLTRQNRTALALTVLLSAATSLTAQAPAVYQVDGAHSSVTFRIRHLISKVSGSFRQFTGTVQGNPKEPEKAGVEFTIKTASIDTANEDRDKHLKSPDFLDAEKFPEIAFKSSKIVPAGAGRFVVHGKFTMHGVTKDLAIPVVMNGPANDPWGAERVGFEIVLTLNRQHFGITWNKALDQGGMILGDEVEVTIALEAVKKVEEKKGEEKKP